MFRLPSVYAFSHVAKPVEPLDVDFAIDPYLLVRVLSRAVLLRLFESHTPS